MKIDSICKNYFNSFLIIKNQKSSKKEKLFAKLCIASYLFILPPVIFGIGYGISKIFDSYVRLEHKVELQKKLNGTIIKTQSEYSKNLHTEKFYRDSQKKKQVDPKNFPIVINNLKPGFFVDVLNNSGYVINGKKVLIPRAQKPTEFKRNKESFREYLDFLKTKYKISGVNKIKFHFKDLTTEQAINESNTSKIALNFANEHHAGGGPGFHKAKDTNFFIYDAPSARAQEESLCQRSDLMASLTQLPHTLKPDSSNSNFIRSYYDREFDSRKMAYMSLNHLFAVQENRDFYHSRYLEEPKKVAFITSAAANYGDKKSIDCSKNSKVYNDAKQRIETHLLAAALMAGISKMDTPDQPVEIILGAFGCGAFAPRDNSNEYRQMIANIYKELLPELQGFFDVITFAVPTFGNTNPRNPVVANNQIFASVLTSLS